MEFNLNSAMFMHIIEYKQHRECCLFSITKMKISNIYNKFCRDLGKHMSKRHPPSEMSSLPHGSL